MIEHTKVPCNGCRACCSQAVFLFPAQGDDASQYETVEAVNPITSQPSRMLRMKQNGDCHYLGADGCTIYDRIPAVCTMIFSIRLRSPNPTPPRTMD